MTTLLLVIIYLSFISLGLPDSLLGAAWPSMHISLGANISYAGLVTMTIAAMTIVSSLFCTFLTKKLGAGKLTALSVGVTACALMGFSYSDSFLSIILWSIPYGLGAGSVDAALNNFVALNFKSRHMSWLHCFWGIGASLGPYIMGLCLTGGLKWNMGYRIIGYLQIALTLILVISLPLWKKGRTATDENGSGAKTEVSVSQALKIKGVPFAMGSFFCYCSLESTAGLWASSYLVLYRGMPEDAAASLAALFYLGITGGRFINGLFTDKLGDKTSVRAGQIIVLGACLIIMFASNEIFIKAGLILVGLGCAPVYPGLIHEAPQNFGKEASQAVISLQMASAYTGTTLMPLLFGFIADTAGIKIYPFYLFFIAVLMLAVTERVNRTPRKH